MKKIFLGITLVLALVGMASATPVSCVTAASTAANVLTPGFSCTLGGLTFSGFSAQNSGNTPNPQVNLITLSAVLSNGTVFLGFNPNLTAAAGQSADILFFFTVTGGIDQIDLAVGGSHATINENACTVPFPGGPPPTSTFCSEANLLANIHAGSGQTATSDLFATTSPVYIAKDINLNNSAGSTDLVFSEFTQSFHPGVPEPASMVLFGTGLVSLAGVIRRKFRA